MISVQRAKLLKQSSNQNPKSSKVKKKNHVLSFNAEKRMNEFVDEYKNCSQDDQKLQLEVLNGIYKSSNVNLHKFRDYDPTLKTYIPLKDVPTGQERAQKTQQEYLKNYIVNQTLWNGGPMRKIERSRSKVGEDSHHMDYGNNQKTENERITKHLIENPIDAVPPANRQLICSPNWREHSKEKWMDQNGFQTGLQKNFFKIQSAWSLHPAANQRPDPYEDGVYNIGHKFRPKKEIKELNFGDSTGKIKSFSTATTPNYLHRGNFMIKSDSNMKLNSQQHRQNISIHHQTRDSIKKSQVQTPPMTPDNMQAILIKISEQDSQDAKSNFDRNIKDFGISISGLHSRKMSTQQQSHASLQNSQSVSTIQKQPSQMNIYCNRDEVEQLNEQSRKCYLKSIETHVPFGYLCSSQIKAELLAKTVQSKRQSRPMTAISKTQQQAQSQAIFAFGQDDQYSVESNIVYPVNIVKTKQYVRPMTSFKKIIEKPSIERPFSAILTKCTSSDKLISLGGGINNKDYRPQSSMNSIMNKTNQSKSTRNSSACNSKQLSVIEEAVSRHFDRPYLKAL